MSKRLTVAWHRKSERRTGTHLLVKVPRSDIVLLVAARARARMCFEQICVAPVTATDNDSDTEMAEHVVA